jgi:hypothetical protein
MTLFCVFLSRLCPRCYEVQNPVKPMYVAQTGKQVVDTLFTRSDLGLRCGAFIQLLFLC